ncbi:AfsR/SARP family transcriptional regulator [Actinoplanes derwentensis]|uniref:Transcriptional regulatory protein, C terminal n=1 Tax=Actinoplanes derwentensis TaxID=113562 RepID=A0A1H1YJR4_9ACTN|nr:winged helix-turn-helix domain-containing protein [Actinoplanes derwentensis]GID81168.1 hypothetical protein Ade03nite_00920 [Actinoplanes derwentensis]SDT21519.1 Transcriptional regulatory protein, C terminal [Actinoplanes derwentensis]
MVDDALRFDALGPVHAYRGDEPIDVGPRNQQAVLGLLLARAGRPVSVTEIAGALWGGDPPENGEDIVLRYIGALRRILDPDRTALIAFTGGGYVLNAAQRTSPPAPPAPKAPEPAQTRPMQMPEPAQTRPVQAPVAARTKAELAKTMIEMAPAPPEKPAPSERPAQEKLARTRIMTPEPDHPVPVDPWDGHDLFPPDPLAMG